MSTPLSRFHFDENDHILSCIFLKTVWNIRGTLYGYLSSNTPRQSLESDLGPLYHRVQSLREASTQMFEYRHGLFIRRMLRHSAVLSIQTGRVQVGKAQANWDTVRCFVTAAVQVITNSNQGIMRTGCDACCSCGQQCGHQGSELSDILEHAAVFRGKMCRNKQVLWHVFPIPVGYQIQFFLLLRTKWPHRLYLKDIS